MKVDLLKKLIKEAVKEGVREELTEILTELVHPTSSEKTPEISKPASPEQIMSSKDPLSEMINMTKTSMGSEDYKNILNFQASDARNFMATNFGQTSTNREIPSGPQPGIDISNLDFVKKAAAVYNRSVQKDKQKLGVG